MALEALYGVDTGVQLNRLPELCRLVEEISGIPNGYFKPIVGEGAFRYEQWSATKAFIEGGARPSPSPSNQRWWGAHRNWSSASGATAAR
ncbi:MAG: hypothetical protein R2873_24785 [Caldilineaceae bacterium]